MRESARISLISLFVAALAAACGAPSPATPSPLPTWATVKASPSPGAAWLYVALGDSNPFGYMMSGQSYVVSYARFIEADLGVKVTVRNWAKMGQWTADLLEMLRTDQNLRVDLARANVITLSIGWDHIEVIGYGKNVVPVCSRRGKLDLPCVQTAVREMEDRLDAILAEIAALRSPSDALIRVMDQPNPWIPDWKAHGTFQQLKGPAADAWNTHLAQTAAKLKMTVVPAYRALNGPNGDQPIPAAYQWPDGIHFDEDGHAVLADLHRQAGYDLAAR